MRGCCKGGYGVGEVLEGFLERERVNFSVLGERKERKKWRREKEVASHFGEVKEREFKRGRWLPWEAKDLASWRSQEGSRKMEKRKEKKEKRKRKRN